MTRSLAQDETERAAQRAGMQLGSPWITGSFYLVSLVVVVVVLLVAAKSLPPWSFPVVLVGGLVAVVVIAAFQLRQDERLSEENLVTLVRLTFKKLPVIAGRRDDSAE